MRGHARLRGVLPGFLGLAAGLAALGGALPAEARVEAVRWRYSAPGRVSGFRIHVGATPGNYTQVIDAGKPQRNANDVYTYQVNVADNTTVYVAVSAYDGQQQSPLSNVTTRPGAAPPPPPPANPPPGNPPPGNPPPNNPPPSNPPPSNPPPSNPPPTSGPHHQPDRPDSPDSANDSKLRERFSSYEEGASPPGWVATGPGNRDAGDPLFSVLSLKKNKVLATTSTTSDIYSHYVTSESVTWSRYEFTGRMRIDDRAAGIGVTVLSQHPDRDSYYRVRRGSNAGGADSHGGNPGQADFQMAPRPDRPAGCTLAATGVTPEPDRWYRFRVQVAAEADGTSVRAKVWKRGSAQPKAWQIDCFDTSEQRLLRGVPGVWSAGPGTKMWDDLTVEPLREAPKRDRHGAPPGKPILGE